MADPALPKVGKWRGRGPASARGAAHDRQNGKQQDVRQLIEFAFGAPWIGDCREVRQETFE